MKPACSHCGGSGTEPEPATVEPCASTHPIAKVRCQRSGPHDDHTAPDPTRPTHSLMWSDTHVWSLPFRVGVTAPEPARPPAVTREDIDVLQAQIAVLRNYLGDKLTDPEWQSFQTALARARNQDEDEARRDADRREGK